MRPEPSGAAAPAADAPPAADAGGAGPPGLARRIWGMRLWVHTAALAVVLAGLVLVSGPGVAYSSDEGAALLQARILEDTGSWLYRSPLAHLDPEDDARPFLRGDQGEAGMAPYAKHPAYPLLLLLLDRMGTLGMLAGSVFGTVVAARVAAALSRELRADIERMTLWVVGLASPLLFDTLLVLAHTLAAAATAGAAWCAVVALRAPGRRALSPGRRALALVGVVVGVWIAAALRTEALLLGPAIAGGALVSLRRRRSTWAVPSAVAVAALAGSAIAYVADRAGQIAILGPLSGYADEAPVGFVAGRIQAVQATWLAPSYGDVPLVDGALWLALVLLGSAALLVRARRSPEWVLGLAWAAFGCYLVRLVLGEPGGPIPGLFVAFPVLWVAIFLVDPRQLTTPGARLLGVATLLGVGGVMATQYARGGGLEWGGRYFAFLMPLAVPLAVAALAHVADDLGPRSRLVRGGGAALLAISVLLAIVAVRSVSVVHAGTDSLLRSMAAAAEGRPAQGGRPVVVSTNKLLPQIGYRDFDDYDWLVPRDQDLTSYGDRLAASGRGPVLLVTDDVPGLLARLPGWREVARSTGPDRSYQVVVIEPVSAG